MPFYSAESGARFVPFTSMAVATRQRRMMEETQPVPRSTARIVKSADTVTERLAKLAVKQNTGERRNKAVDIDSLFWKMLDPQVFYCSMYPDKGYYWSPKRTVDLVRYYYAREGSVKKIKPPKDVENPYGMPLHIPENMSQIIGHVCWDAAENRKQLCDNIPSFQIAFDLVSVLEHAPDDVKNIHSATYSRTHKVTIPIAYFRDAYVDQRTRFKQHVSEHLTKIMKTNKNVERVLMHVSTNIANPIKKVNAGGKTCMYVNPEYTHTFPEDYGHHTLVVFDIENGVIEHFDSFGRDAIRPTLPDGKGGDWEAGGSTTIFRWLHDVADDYSDVFPGGAVFVCPEEDEQPLQNRLDATCQNWTLLWSISRAGGIDAKSLFNLLLTGLDTSRSLAYSDRGELTPESLSRVRDSIIQCETYGPFDQPRETVDDYGVFGSTEVYKTLQVVMYYFRRYLAYTTNSKLHLGIGNGMITGDGKIFEKLTAYSPVKCVPDPTIPIIILNSETGEQDVKYFEIKPDDSKDSAEHPLSVLDALIDATTSEAVSKPRKFLASDSFATEFDKNITEPLFIPV